MIPNYGNPKLSLLKDGGNAMLPDGYRLFGSDSSHRDILYEEDCLTAEECGELVRHFKRYERFASSSGGDDPSNFRRIIRLKQMSGEEGDHEAIIRAWRRPIADRIRKFLNSDVELYANDIQIAEWLPGQPPPGHAGAFHPDGGPRATQEAGFTAIVYLNDEFAGGYDCFEDYKIAIAPRKGLLVAFKGGLDHVHGVTALLSGRRFTLTCSMNDYEMPWDSIDPDLQSEADRTGGDVVSPVANSADGVGLRCYALSPVPPRLAPASPVRQWMDETFNKFAYRCLPLTIANTYGWEVQSPGGLTVTWNGGGGLKDLEIIGDDDYPDADKFTSSHFGQGIVTFHTKYLFQTNPGWQLLATGPFNNPKHGIAPLTGVIETDWLPFPFTMNWHMTEPGSVRFEKDEPVCLIFPVAQGTLEATTPEIHSLEDNPELGREYEIWRESRTEFNAGLREGDAKALRQRWQKNYYKGEFPGSGTKAPSHMNKLRLKIPVDRRKG